MKYSRNIIAASRTFTCIIPAFPPCKRYLQSIERTVRKHKACTALFFRHPLPNLQLA
jgi:hypothetical protein